MPFRQAISPWMQAHWPLSQLKSLGHAWPQAPQLLASVEVSVSHPSSGVPLQSEYPVSHGPSAHAPPVQIGVAWGSAHGVHEEGEQP
jgi:hypothetical protein